MKYSIMVILFIVSLGYAGYYLYMYDKQKKTVGQVESGVISKKKRLTKGFWRNITPNQLKKKLKNIKNINKVKKDSKRSMLHFLVVYGKYPEMVEQLVSAGIDYRLKDRRGLKALHYTVFRRKKTFEFTKELLKYDKEVNEIILVTRGKKRRKKRKRTLLTFALHNRAPIKVIKLLLENGADPNLPETGPHSLILASIPNKNRNTSFINPKVIQLLLDYKADPKRKNHLGKTAYDYMKSNSEFIKTELFQRLSKSIK